MTEYRLLRSNRRTLSISVDDEGALVVHAPLRMPLVQIEAFLHQKQRWIVQKQTLARQACLRRKQAQLVEGACIPFWGNALVVHFSAISAAYDAGGTLFLPCGSDAVKTALQWRNQRACELLSPRVQHWAAQSGLVPQSLAFGNAKKRWGSMSTRGSLRLHTALIHVPPALADYVIVHELAHLVHPDHSPAFHQLVRFLLPQADLLRQRLKDYAYVLSLWH